MEMKKDSVSLMISIEITRSEEQQEKNNRKTKRALWDNGRIYNACVVGVSGEE